MKVSIQKHGMDGLSIFQGDDAKPMVKLGHPTPMTNPAGRLTFRPVGVFKDG